MARTRNKAEIINFSMPKATYMRIKDKRIDIKAEIKIHLLSAEDDNSPIWKVLSGPNLSELSVPLIPSP